MTILEWVKENAKEGANIAEVEELIERANPINRVKTQAEAEVFINDTPAFKSFFDAYVSRATENHETKFMELKLPEILKEEREKIRKELNPDETDEQKAIRELKEANQRLESDIKRKELVAELRAKAKDYSLPDNIADGFAVYGDDAIENLSKVGDYFKSAIKTGIEEGIKSKFKGSSPPSSGQTTGKVMARDEFANLSPAEQSKFMSEGGTLE